MIVLMDTSTPECRLTLVSEDATYEHIWQANRELAKGLLAFLRDSLGEHQREFQDISGIGVMLGPGSFTGLRIGITVANTLSDSLSISIVGTATEKWQEDALQRLHAGENDRLLLPAYGAEANITKPRK